MRTELRWEAEPRRQRTGWAGMGEGLTPIRGKGGRERVARDRKIVRETWHTPDGKYDRAEMKDPDGPGCVMAQAEA